MIVKLSDVSFRYTPKGNIFSKRQPSTVLSNINLEFDSGEFIGLSGQNGAGKTTLLNILAGVLTPTSGHTLLNYKSIDFLGLHNYFDPNLTGRDNVTFALMLGRMQPEQIKACIGTVKSFSGLGDSFERPIKEYSTGMKARLGFSVSHVKKADLILIDEVIAVGDHEFRKKCISSVKLSRDRGSTVVLVTHNHGLIEELCDRTVRLENGKISAQVDQLRHLLTALLDEGEGYPFWYLRKAYYQNHIEGTLQAAEQ